MTFFPVTHSRIDNPRILKVTFHHWNNDIHSLSRPFHVIFHEDCMLVSSYSVSSAGSPRNINKDTYDCLVGTSIVTK